MNTTAKEPQTGRDCNHSQLFRYYYRIAHQYGVTNREALLKDNQHTLI